MTPEEFFAILHDVPTSRPLTHRLYHDEQGHPLFYSMEDLPGLWIEVDAVTYVLAPFHVRVDGGRLIHLPKPGSEYRKLEPTQEGTCCHPKDVCIVVSPNRPNVKWSMTEIESDRHRRS